jgi:hypothetical protein
MGFGRGGKGDFEKGVEKENWKLENLIYAKLFTGSTIFILPSYRMNNIFFK